MPGSGNIDHVEVVFFDDPVQVGADEILSRRRPPVAQQHVFHIFEAERRSQQWIIIEINLPDRQVIGRTPVGIYLVK